MKAFASIVSACAGGACIARGLPAVGVVWLLIALALFAWARTESSPAMEDHKHGQSRKSA